MKKVLFKTGTLLGLIFLWIVGAQAQAVSVTGNLRDLGVNNATQQNTYVLFTLQNFGSNIPRVIGTNAIVSAISPPFRPNGSGVISGNIQSNDSITPNTTFYRVCIYFQGTLFQCNNYTINYSQSSTWNLNTATPSTPIPPLPTNTQSANTVYSGPCVGAAAGPTFRPMCGADLPNPAPSSRGGVDSQSCIAGSHVVSINTDGSVTCSMDGGGGGGTGLSTDNTWTNNNRFKGPIPFADVTAFGARPVSSVPSTTASCAGTTSLTFTSVTGFRIGDGVTVLGCGPTNTMSTPSAPTVTPSLAAGETGTEWVVNSGTGSSTYNYKIVARDKFGAVTAPSSVTTITNGRSSLGLQIANITSLTRANDVVTVVTATTNLLAALAAVQIESTLSKAFNAWFSVGSITNGTTFVLNATPNDTRAQSWQVGDVANVGSGGRIAYYLGNHISWAALAGAWEYYICAERPGDSSYALIGVTKPTGPTTGYQDVQFDDWGSPYMDGQTYPSYITNSICTGSATNDPLTTTITNISGTTVTVANTASQTASEQTVVFDDGPGIVAAVTSQTASVGNGGAIYIPPAPSGGNYYINSYTVIPVGAIIWQSGYLALNETMEIDKSTSWFGDWGSYQTPQFGFGPGAVTQARGANPGIYLNGGSGVGIGNTFRGLSWYTAATNGGVMFVGDNINGTNFNHMNFITGAGGASTDYLSMAVVLRNTTGTIDNSFFDTVLFSGGPDQVNDKSWTPLFWTALGQNGSGGSQGTFYSVRMSNSYWNRRGIASEGALFQSENMYSQGNITPMFALQLENICTQNCGDYVFTNETEDTTVQPVMALLYQQAPQGTPANANIYFNRVVGPGINGPLISGTRPVGLKMEGFNFYNAALNTNRDTIINGSAFRFTYAPYATGGSSVPASGGLQTIAEPVHIPSGHSLYFDLQPPNTVTAATAGGGSVPVGTWYYAVNHTGADGGETILSIPASPVTTSGGTQTVNVGWANSPGYYSTNVYRCTVSCLATDGTANNNVQWYRLAQHVTGATYVDTASAPTLVTIPQVTGTGSTIANKNGFYAPLFTTPAGSATITIAKGSQALGTTAISSGGCATVITVSVPGADATAPNYDRVVADENSDLSGVTGYSGTGGVLQIYKWVSPNNANFHVCNWTGSSITPGAATLNWAVTR